MRIKILHIHLSNDLGTNDALPRALEGIASEYQQVDWLKCPNTNVTVLKIARTMKPDLVFYQTQSSDVLTTQTVDELSSLGACVIGWSGDVRDPLPPHYLKMAPHVNCTLFTNWPDVETMRIHGLRSDFLQVGYDQRIYCYEGPKTKCPPIVFLGANYGAGKFPNSQQRIDMVEDLRKEFGKDFEVYGTGWGTRFLNPPEEAAVYRSCKVAIHQDHFTREGFHSDRLLRINGCGHFAVLWNEYTMGSCVKHIHEVLNAPANEDERRSISRSTAESQSWDARMPRLLELYETYR